MGVAGGPLVADQTNLAFSMDMHNHKSNKGKPSTNVVLNQNLNHNWSKSYTESIRWNKIKPPQGVVAPVVGFRNDDTGGQGFWYSYGDWAPMENSTQYSVSIYIRTNDATGCYIRYYTGDNSESDRVTGPYKYIIPTGETDSSYDLLTGASKNLADKQGWIRLEWNDAFTTDSDCDVDSLSFRYVSLRGSPTYKRMWLCAPQLEASDVCTPYVSPFSSNHADLTGTPSVGANSASVRGNALYNLKTGKVVDSEAVTHLANREFSFVSQQIDTGFGGYPTTFAEDFSVECWIYYDSSLNWSNSYRSSIVTRGSYGGSHGLWRSPSAGVVSSWCRANGTSKSRTVALTDNAWNHIIMTWENDTLMALYKNGELGSSYDPGDLASVGTPDQLDWIIGGQSAASGAQGNMYVGKIAKVQIYKSALSANQVKQNFAAHRQKFGL